MKMTFNVIIKEEEGLCVAHCLELDIVATGDTTEKAWGEMVDLIGIQVGYAFSNDNLENLYRPAPPEVWEEFYACQEKTDEKEIQVPLTLGRETKDTARFVPPWIIAQMCQPPAACRV